MKAREYATQWNEWRKTLSFEDAFVELGLKFQDEIHTLFESRNCITNSACIAVLKELNQKWRALQNLETEISCIDFELIVKAFSERFHGVAVKYGAFR